MADVTLAPAARRPRGDAHLARALAASLVALAFATPALWNGFPLIFFDTGGYLTAALHGAPMEGRAAIYGALLELGAPFAFWPVVALQCAVMAWLLVLVLRAHGVGRPGPILALGLALALATSLPWYAAQLMPDVFAPAAVLALYLLAFHARRLARATRLALAAIVAFAGASHMATLALVTGLAICLALWRIAPRPLGARARPRAITPALTAAAAVALSIGSNAVLIDRAAFTPGGVNFLFGRLVETGIAERFLADNCPDATLRLCAYAGRLPESGDDWLWDDVSPLYQLGGWDAFADEAGRIVAQSLHDYPFHHLGAALAGTVTQLVMVRTGDGLTSWSWNAQWVIGSISPELAARLHAARQQREPILLGALNAVHVPLALGATALLPFLVWRARRRPGARSGAFAAFVVIALLGNAFICGALSNPHDRYQSRVAPLALLVAGLAALSLRIGLAQRSATNTA